MGLPEWDGWAIFSRSYTGTVRTIVKKHPYLSKSCPTCGAARGQHCARLSWPHYKTRPHKARLKKLKAKK